MNAYSPGIDEEVGGRQIFGAVSILSGAESPRLQNAGCQEPVPPAFGLQTLLETVQKGFEAGLVQTAQGIGPVQRAVDLEGSFRSLWAPDCAGAAW